MDEFKGCTANISYFFHHAWTLLQLNGGVDHLFSKFCTCKVRKLWFYCHCRFLKDIDFGGLAQ